MTVVMDFPDGDLGVCVMDGHAVRFAGSFSQPMDDGEPPITLNAVLQRERVDLLWHTPTPLGSARRAQ